MAASSGLASPAWAFAVSMPNPIMYADCAVVSWTAWENSTRSR